MNYATFRTESLREYGQRHGTLTFRRLRKFNQAHAAVTKALGSEKLRAEFADIFAQSHSPSWSAPNSRTRRFRKRVIREAASTFGFWPVILSAILPILLPFIKQLVEILIEQLLERFGAMQSGPVMPTRPQIRIELQNLADSVLLKDC